MSEAIWDSLLEFRFDFLADVRIWLSLMLHIAINIVLMISKLILKSCVTHRFIGN